MGKVKAFEEVKSNQEVNDELPIMDFFDGFSMFTSKPDTLQPYLK